MSNASYTSKYPAIIIDKHPNSVNDSMKKTLTVEEYYDIMHHTHDVSNLNASDGEMTYQEMQTTVVNLNNTVNELTNTIKEQNNTINDLTNTIKEQHETIQRIEEINEEMRQNIITLNEEMKSTASVSDWDVTTPGIQDIEGNTLGEFMGFNVVEINE